MTCLDDAQITAFVAAELPAAIRARYEEHVDDCAGCRRLVAGVIREARAAQVVGRYVVGEILGRGAMGTVYRAEDSELHRAVALKRLHRGDHARLLREARVAAQLQHPNVVAVYEVVDDPVAPAIAMELVDGVTLTAWLRERPRSWREILDVVIQAGRGLAAAHARQLVHRDFKPDNVLVDRDGRARVADFGLAASGGTAASGIALGSTRSGGTPAYMAPELAAGGEPDAQSDVFALAVTLFEALHGKHPFDGTSIEAMWAAMAAGRIRDGGARVPAEIERCVRRGLAVDRAQRWRSVADFVAALERARRPRHRTLAVATLAAVVVGTVVRIATAGAAEPDTCAAGVELVSSVWNPNARVTLDRELTAVAATRGHADAVATADAIDQWAGSWQLARRAACSAGPHRTAAIACLDRRLDELRAQLAMWARPTARDADHASSAATSLAAPDECSTSPLLTLPAQLVVARLTQVKVLSQSGHDTAALPQLPALVREAEAVGDHGTLANVLYVAARINYQLEHMDDAAALSARAAAEASKVGDDALMYLALDDQALAWVESDRATDALGITAAAEALAQRGLPRPWLVHSARAAALMRLGRVPEALADQQTAVAMCEAVAKTTLGVRSDCADALSNLAGMYDSAHEWDHAIAAADRALPLLAAEYGPDHPRNATALYQRAQAEGNKLDYAAAIRDTRRGRDVLAAAYGEGGLQIVQYDLAIARFQAQSGDVAQARGVLERAQITLATKLPPDHWVFAMIEDTLGEIEHDANHCAAAIPHYQHEVAIYRAGHVRGENLAETESDLAGCFEQLGRHPEAKQAAEIALDEYDHASAPDASRALPWMVLAEVAHAAGDRATAIAFARKVVAVTTDAPAPDGDNMGHAIRVDLARWTQTVTHR